LHQFWAVHFIAMPKPLKKAKIGKVADINPYSKALDLCVKVTATLSTVESKGKTFHKTTVGDECGTVVLSLALF